MSFITRKMAFDNLSKHIGENLEDFAYQYGVTIIGESGKINKGWKGQTAECIAGLTPSNERAPNGNGWELKTVSYHFKNGVWTPRETVCISMINHELKHHSFRESVHWDKLKKLIVCAVEWRGQHSNTSRILGVKTFDLSEESELIRQISQDYEFSRAKYLAGEPLRSKYGVHMQPRTKGAGHGSTSRAFYLRRVLC